MEEGAHYSHAASSRGRGNPGSPRAPWAIAAAHRPCARPLHMRAAMAWGAPSKEPAMALQATRVFRASSRPATCISATISARSSSSSSCRTSYDCIYCVVDLHAITVWQDPAELPRAIREVTAAFIACRHRSEAAHRVQPEPGRRARRARLGVQLRGAARLAQPHDAVQGEGRQGPRECVGRALRLSEPDGGRHSGLSRDPRAGRRGPEAASRAVARHRAEIQQRLRRHRFARTASAMRSSRCPSR